jgi:hypothetical protein
MRTANLQTSQTCDDSGEEEEPHRKRNTPEHITKEGNKQRANIQSILPTQNKHIIDSTLHRTGRTNTHTRPAQNMAAT